MADLRPFRALRYDPARVRLEDVLTQPYDKISPAMQAEYYARSPYNLIRFELAKPAPGAAQRTYAQSAEFLSELQRQGVLRLDETPSLYAYSQRFQHPLEPTRTLERTGIIALGRLHAYDEGVVLRHEQTLSGPKLDRMNLLRATRTHSGQIFMLYEDPLCHIYEQVAELIAGRSPESRVIDEYGVQNLLWQISDPAGIAALIGAFADKKLIIADGHHRYETALSYRDAQPSSSGVQPHDFVMMTLVNVASPGLIVLPTHRVVFGLDGADWAQIRSRLAEFFQVETDSVPGKILQQLQQERAGTAFAMVTASGAWLLRGIGPAIAQALPSLSPEDLKVDVTVLHRIILERVLGLSEEDVREQRRLRYFREAETALRELQRSASAVFLVNAVPLPVLRDVCYAGKVMPQKSTDFYPKLLSGLTLYDLDRSFEGLQRAETR